MLVEWETGETTYEPLHLIAADDPVSCAKYAKDNDLLHLPGWKQFKKLAKKEKTLQRMINESKTTKHKKGPIYPYGYQVPRNHQEAVMIDRRNGNTKWVDAERLELSQLADYQTFVDHGVADIAKDGQILQAARNAASDTLDADPKLEKPENQNILRHIQSLKKTVVNWGRIS